MLTDGGSSPPESVRLAVTRTRLAAISESEAVFAILTSVAAATRAWNQFLSTKHSPHDLCPNS